jgi:hypothetical protein
MSGNLPPKPEAPPPEDFEGRVHWVNNRVTQVLAQSAAEDKSPIHPQTREALPWAAVFSESRGELVQLNDGEAPLELRTRYAQRFPCRQQNGLFALGVPEPRDGFYVLWEIEAGQAVPETFIDHAGREGIDKEKALSKLVDVLNAPDAEIVPVNEIF